jgi:MFS family permease
MILAYHQLLGLTVKTSQALFGIYALGLVPALLLGGPLSDRWGRSRILQPAAVFSVLATVVLARTFH